MTEDWGAKVVAGNAAQSAFYALHGGRDQDAGPDTLYGIFDAYLETFTEAYETQREADDRAIELNDLNFNSYDRVAGAEEPFSVDQLPTPWPAWAVR